MPERSCTEDVRNGRLSKARQFEEAAALIEEYAGDTDDLNDAYITLCVHAGIAAADTICCARLGVHHQGENHNDAIALLRRVDSKLADDLGALLKMKTAAAYGATPSSAASRKRAARATARLMDAARANR